MNRWTVAIVESWISSIVGDWNDVKNPLNLLFLLVFSGRSVYESPVPSYRPCKSTKYSQTK